MKHVAIFQAAAVAFCLLFTAGCASTARSGDEAPETIDIRWLTIQLQDEGVFVTERGQPDPTIVANSAGRLVLNSREFLDVYTFQQSDRARLIATELVGLHPDRDIYLKETMVVVRYSRRDTGLNGVLNRLLGRTQ